MHKILTLSTIILTGCSLSQERSAYEQLIDYEGHYEYVGESTLDLMASGYDTTLYAVIEKAKYPLTRIAQDSFVNVSNQAVVFDRDEHGKVIRYRTGGQAFQLLSKDFEKMEMFPRKELFGREDEYTYEAPKPKEDGLAVGDLYEEFAQADLITDMVKKTIKGEYPDVHSILIFKHGKLVLEEYFYGYDANTPHQLRSASKTLVGGMLGIAIDQGFIPSEEEKLLPFFEKKYAQIENKDTRKAAITIADFLRYRHGMDCENDNRESLGNELRMMESEDWVKYTLDLPMVAEPGESSSYCTGCALTIGSLVEVVTGEQIEDFAKKHFFDPMGITEYAWTFEPNPSSVVDFSQMYITPRDLVRIAKMYKDGGVWEGQQIISQEWVDKTFTMEKGDYGYLWLNKYYEIDGKTYNSYLATGNGGQKINIWPDLDMITVFTGGNYNSYALYGKSTPPNEMIPTYILRAL